MTRVYEDFISRFGARADFQRNVVQIYVTIGDAYARRNNIRESVRQYEKAIQFFNAHPAISTDFLANNLAAKAQFLLVDMEYDSYRAVRIAGQNPQAMARSFSDKEARMKAVIESFKKVKQFRSPEYYLASNCRSAQAVVLFADALFEAPVPRDLQRLGEEYVLEYQQQLADQARPYYEAAAKTLLQAFEEAKEAKLFGSPWMKRLIETLNHPNLQNFVGGGVKMRKPEKTRFRRSVTSPLPLDNGRPHERVKPEESPAAAPGATPAS